MKKIIFLFVTFFVLVLSLSSCNKNNETKTDDYKYTVVAPSGAPSVALATMALENTDAYSFIAADTIASAFSSNEADFVLAPINAGAKLFKAGKSTYRLSAIITWGNLYFASQIENFSLDTINGHDLILFGENTINASIAKYVLEKKNITPSNITYLSGASNTQATLLSDANAIVMTAEPALTAAKTKNANIKGLSIQSLYKEVSGNSEFTQAGIFVKADTITNHSSIVSDFLLSVKDVADNLNTNLDKVAEACVELKIMPALAVAKKAIPNCSIKFADALDSKAQVEATAKIDLIQFGGDVPSEGFYYSAF